MRAGCPRDGAHALAEDQLENDQCGDRPVQDDLHRRISDPFRRNHLTVPSMEIDSSPRKPDGNPPGRVTPRSDRPEAESRLSGYPVTVSSVHIPSM